jgi:hypothetical protein
MRCLTYAECAAWCNARDYPIADVDHYGRPAPAVLNSYVHVPLVYPEDSGRKVQLSRNVVSRLLTSGELLLWIGDWAVWPTSQHMPLFTRFRQAFGETPPLIEAPGHLPADRTRIASSTSCRMYAAPCQLSQGYASEAYNAHSRSLNCCSNSCCGIDVAVHN